MPQYKLTYFDVKGQGEPVRFMLSYVGKEFEDVRIKVGPAWPPMKSKMPFGKLPVLEIDGAVYSDSIAICRYLAKEGGIAGDTPLETLHIDQIIGAICDCKAELGKLYRAEESVKEKLIETLVKETLPFYLGKLEKMAQENGGYLANKKLSWADIYFLSFIEQAEKMCQQNLSKNYPNLLTLIEKVRSQPGIQKWIKRRPSED